MTPDTPEDAANQVPPPPPPPPPQAAEGAPTAEGTAPPAEGAAPEAPKADEPKKPEIEFPEDAKKGRIRTWNPGNKQGEIQADGDTTGVLVKFHVKQVANPAPEPKDGDKVAFKAPEPAKSAK